ncbi:MAG: DUF2520 domain-containing protein [Burkholderiales bacterium]|nr:DUF2520 domain-containing protein [Burkholderiales bacterium]
MTQASTLSLGPPQNWRIGFIGAGRLGQALAWSLAQAGLKVVAVHSLVLAHANNLAQPLQGCVSMSAQDVVDNCDVVFVTTPDSAIRDACDQLQWRIGQASVHCSGVTEVDALAMALSHGACIGGFHPMQTFGDPHAAVRSLAGCTITLEAQDPGLMEVLLELTQRLGCLANQLPAGMRGRYHAAAGYTSQFINALFDQAVSLWQTWGATEEQALRALLPLAQGTLSSIERAGVARGMPGPVSRADLSSIEKHLYAISPMGKEMLHFYTTLCMRTVALAEKAGGIDEKQATQFRDLLQSDANR